MGLWCSLLELAGLQHHQDLAALPTYCFTTHLKFHSSAIATLRAQWSPCLRREDTLKISTGLWCEETAVNCIESGSVQTFCLKVSVNSLTVHRDLQNSGKTCNEWGKLEDPKYFRPLFSLRVGPTAWQVSQSSHTTIFRTGEKPTLHCSSSHFIWLDGNSHFMNKVVLSTEYCHGT